MQCEVHVPEVIVYWQKNNVACTSWFSKCPWHRTFYREGLLVLHQPPVCNNNPSQLTDKAWHETWHRSHIIPNLGGYRWLNTWLARGNKKRIQNFVVKFCDKLPLVRPRRRLKGNIKKYHRKTVLSEWFVCNRLRIMITGGSWSWSCGTLHVGCHCFFFLFLFLRHHTRYNTKRIEIIVWATDSVSLNDRIKSFAIF
jgi:hypothetical protein